ncbi:MAG TPA: hypothetical protein VM308_01595 [Sphingomicrobium sp.]|nr:hypothetical protein [Sphingomicrobium sp.]
MSRTAAELLMARETRVALGTVPHSLTAEALPERSWQLKSDEFLLRASGEHYFFYRKGGGLRIERGPGAQLDEEALWLNGSVYAAIASINGLLPIHASAVALGGGVYAFTGPPGSGKSTLVAALGARGLPMFCDDTLILDPSDSSRILCLPGHKRLKLKPDAIHLTGAKPAEKVGAGIDKFYCEPPAGEVAEALPLRELIFLDEGADTRITPLSGVERFVRVQDDHYTAQLYAEAREFNLKAHFEHLTTLARGTQMAQFKRPRDRSFFDQGVGAIAKYLCGRESIELP